MKNGFKYIFVQIIISEIYLPNLYEIPCIEMTSNYRHYDNDQLERIRDEINNRIKELQDEKAYDDELNQEKKFNDIYENLCSNHVDQWVSDLKKSLSNINIVDEIIKNLDENPFGTEVNLIDLSIENCKKLTPLFKIWYENTIKSRNTKDKIKIILTVNNEEI